MQAADALQVDTLVHALPAPHCVPTATGVWTTPVDRLHESAVQGFPSSTGSGAPAMHEPTALQVEAAVQAVPAAHCVPWATGMWVTPVLWEHESAVQGFPSSTGSGVPVTQVAAALHTDALAHVVAAPHCVPVATGVWVTPVVGEHASAVHGFPSSTGAGVPATHEPDALQMDAVVQALAAPQTVPLAAGVCVTPPCAPHASVVHGLPSLAGVEPSSARTVTVSRHRSSAAFTWSSKYVPLTVEPAPGRGRWFPRSWHSTRRSAASCGT